eukprot:Skav227381  [mRNA]  locus=scaffold1390:114069:121524:- [translate_table: standard]
MASAVSVQRLSKFNLWRAELSEYFADGYLRKPKGRGFFYEDSSLDEKLTFLCKTVDGEVQVWQSAFDLRRFGRPGEEIVVLFHYTDQLAFLNVANLEQVEAELFASLVEKRALFGQGLYATKHEPSVFGSRLRIFFNNYTNEDPQCANPEALKGNEGMAEKMRDLFDRTAFCIPLIVPKSIAYNVHETLTPDMQQRTETLDGKAHSFTIGQRLRKAMPEPRISPRHQSVTPPGEDALGRKIDKHRRQHLADDNPRKQKILNGYASALRELGKEKTGDPPETEDRPEMLGSLHNLGLVLLEFGELKRATEVLEEAFDLRSSALFWARAHEEPWLTTPGHIEKSGEFGVGPSGLRQPAKGGGFDPGGTEKLGESHTETLSSAYHLALVLHARGGLKHLKEAEDRLRRVVEKREVKLGLCHRETLSSINTLASVLLDLGHIMEAKKLVLDAQIASLGTQGIRCQLGKIVEGLVSELLI